MMCSFLLVFMFSEPPCRRVDDPAELPDTDSTGHAAVRGAEGPRNDAHPEVDPEPTERTKTPQNAAQRPTQPQKAI